MYIYEYIYLSSILAENLLLFTKLLLNTIDVEKEKSK
jgi:hypothetical protein